VVFPIPHDDVPILEVTGFQVELITATRVVRAVDGVDLVIRRGETVTIIGESGSGKSTTAMGLLQLLPADLAVLSGSVKVGGVDLLVDRGAAGRIRGRMVSLIPQDPMTALSPVHTIGQQMREAVELAGHDRAAAEQRSLELLEAVHVRQPADQLRKYPHQLSGGMLQRVLIAIALAGHPVLLVADEPTSALDVTVQAGILDLLMELQERTGVGILMITHDLGVARLVSDRIHVMKDGRFVESGDAEALVAHPQQPYTQRLLAAVPELGPWDETPGSDTARSDTARSETARSDTALSGGGPR
jgi:peptide/nickel transport system ATP-binding protein